jgi:hypothetical protein
MSISCFQSVMTNLALLPEHSTVPVSVGDFHRGDVGHTVEGHASDRLPLKLPAGPGIFHVWQPQRLKTSKIR